MKKLIRFLFIFISMTLLFTACGERGPVGPEGPQGPPGPEILPVAFEFNATMRPSNNFEFFQSIPNQIEVLEQDVMLAFILEDYIPEDDLEVWRKLPVTEFNSRGTLLIDYDFTLIDVRIFMDANYNLNITDSLEDVLIRAVHIPANFTSKMVSGMSFKEAETFEELQGMLGRNIEVIK